MCFQVTINAVVRRVDLAPEEPFGFRRIPFECFDERLEPSQLLGGQISPESFRVGLGFLVQRAIRVEAPDVRSRRELGRWVESGLITHGGRGYSAARLPQRRNSDPVESDLL